MSNDTDTEERGSRGYQHELPEWVWVSAAVFIGGAIGIAATPDQPLVGFAVVSIFLGGVAWVSHTESGERFIDEFSSDLGGRSRQPKQSSSDQADICPNCGAEITRESKFCDDCGIELKRR